ncbi:MAG: peptidoglycan DD-metalloendopeptidase family protein [Patescibacteria group bacterium]
MASLVFGQAFLSFNFANAQETALEASFSYDSAVQNGTNAELVDSNKEVNISGGALLPFVTNIGTIEGIDDGEALSDQISVYVVRKGDSVGQIAEMFGVSINTVLWLNDMKKGDKLVEGATLVILPIDGAKHIVVKGDTLKKIAQKYSADVSNIASYNGIKIDASLSIGQELIVPDAQINEPSVSKSVKTSTTQASLKDTKGYFTYPTVSWAKRIRGIQKYPKHNGVDLAAPVGTPIYAAASGTVIIARSSGYNGGYGRMLAIQHSNGTQTIYGHLSTLNVKNGQKVSKSQTIGTMGSTGRSTGPHLHFEVKGGKNPF